jgi:hypothetical protein
VGGFDEVGNGSKQAKSKIVQGAGTSLRQDSLEDFVHLQVRTME